MQRNVIGKLIPKAAAFLINFSANVYVLTKISRTKYYYYYGRLFCIRQIKFDNFFEKVILSKLCGSKIPFGIYMFKVNN